MVTQQGYEEAAIQAARDLKAAEYIRGLVDDTFPPFTAEALVDLAPLLGSHRPRVTATREAA